MPLARSWEMNVGVGYVAQRMFSQNGCNPGFAGEHLRLIE